MTPSTKIPELTSMTASLTTLTGRAYTDASQHQCYRCICCHQDPSKTSSSSRTPNSCVTSVNDDATLRRPSSSPPASCKMCATKDPTLKQNPSSKDDWMPEQTANTLHWSRKLKTPPRKMDGAHHTIKHLNSRLLVASTTPCLKADAFTLKCAWSPTATLANPTDHQTSAQKQDAR